MGAQNGKGGRDSAFFLYAVFAGPMEAFVLDAGRPLLPRLLLNAGVQFGVAGLGSVAVCILRRERLSSFGLRRKGARPAILGTLLCFVPSVLVLLGAGKIEGVLSSGHPHRAGGAQRRPARVDPRHGADRRGLGLF